MTDTMEMPAEELTPGPLTLRKEPDRALHERNVEFLANRFISCRNLAQYIPQTELKFLENGEPTVFLGETSLYGTDGALTFTENQYETFWRKPMRINSKPPSGEGLDEYSYAYFQKFLKEVFTHNITLYKEVQGRQSDHINVFGVGLAPHLDQLLEDTRCHTMLLIEPNLEFVYHSTFLFDWVAFFDKAKAQNCNVQLLTSMDAGRTISVMRDLLVNQNVMTFDGTLIYKHYPNQFFTAAVEQLQRDINSFLCALGYTEDEFYMLGNTYVNFMKKDETKLFRPQLKNKINMPAIIVGGGPSKDPYYQVIRDNQDKAIIVACGSALESLLQENIMPDILVILERSPKVYQSLVKTAKQWDISNICLIGSTTIDPRIQDLFKQSLFFYRAALSPYQMFGKKNGFYLEGPDPHVGNAGFSFLLLSGIQNIYMFGLDLGSRNPDVHHSKNSLPMQKDTIHDFHALTIKAPGSLGGTIYTCSQFILVRNNLEQMALKFGNPGLIFNCSDGVTIKNTTPKIPRNLQLPEPKISKSTALNGLIEGFWSMPREEFKKLWADYDVRSQVQALSDDVLDIFEKNPNLLEDEALTKLHEYIAASLAKNPSTPAIIIRGNIYMIMLGSWYYLTRVATGEDQERATQIIRDEFKNTMGLMIQDTLDLIDELEAWDPSQGGTIERLMS